MKFCGACGALLDIPVQSDQDAGKLPLSGQPGGELRFVTVLFADLAGFTAFAEDRPPDEVAVIVGDLLQRLGGVVEAFGGGVDKFLEDSVVATFGLPRPDPNAARNAVRAGLEMQKAAVDFNHLFKLNFKLRVGIHAGEVMFRSLGGSWTVMGDTVNTASRIQSAAAPGRVWISRTVYEEVRRFFTLIARPVVDLKGKKVAIQPYEVLSERSTPSMEFPAFVGREAEWARIQAGMRRAAEGQRLDVVVLRGPAGVGKSRVVWELRDWVQRQSTLYRVDVVQYDHSERMPAHGLSTLIRNRFNLPLDLAETEQLQRLRQRIPFETMLEDQADEASNEIWGDFSGGIVSPALADSQGDPTGENGLSSQSELALEFFAFILGLSQPGESIQSMDGRAKWEGAFMEVKAWLETRASQTPWIWVLEDAQKGDADTAAFLDWATQVGWSAPVFVLITLREEDFSSECAWFAPLERWLRGGKAEEIRLRELPTQMLAQALVAMTGYQISLEHACQIAEHAEGNPLFATEVVLLLKDQGLLEAGTAWEKIRLPASMREAMEARLERLGQPGKEVAKRGALMGRRFTREAISRIWEPLPQEMEEGLLVLRETETIYEEASNLFEGEVEEVFRHGRLQEAALARIPREERLRWLLGLEEWARQKRTELGEYWEGAGALLIPLIARSRDEQDDYWEASLWHETLGLLHLKHYRLLEAVQAFHSALGTAAGVRRLVLLRLAVETAAAAGEPEKGLTMIEQSGNGSGAVPEASRCPFPELAWRTLQSIKRDPLACWEVVSLDEADCALDLAKADLLSLLGRVEEARAAYQRVEGLLFTLEGETAVRLWLRLGRSWSYFLCELAVQAAEAGEVIARIQARLGTRAIELKDERLAFLAAEGLVEVRLGRYRRSQAVAEERLQISQATGDRREEANAWNVMGMVHDALRELEPAVNSYMKSLQISRSIGFRRGEVIALHNLGLLYLDRAEWNLAQRCQEEYLTLSRSSGNRLAEGYAPAYLGMLAMEKGDWAQAEEYLKRALTVASENDWRRVAGLAKGLQGGLWFRRWLDDRQPEMLQKSISELLSSEEEWSGLDEAGELYATLALAFTLAGRVPDARAAIGRGQQCIDESWVAAKTWLDAAEEVAREREAGLEGGYEPRAALHWFRRQGFQRGLLLLERVLAIL